MCGFILNQTIDCLFVYSTNKVVCRMEGRLKLSSAHFCYYMARLKGMGEQLQDKLSVIVLLLLFISLLMGIFLPIYSDEVMAKWGTARFFLDDEMLTSFFPQCSTTTGRAVAWVFYPAGILLSAIYAYLGPLGIRISGIVCAVLWFSLVGYWLCSGSHDKKSALRRFAGLLALCSLGVMPYMWDLARTEQIMSLALLVLGLSATVTHGHKTWRGQLVNGFGLAVILSCFFYVHPKSLFYSPFVLAVTWAATNNYRRVVRYVLIAYIVALCVQVFQDSNTLAACQDAPLLQKILSVNTLLPKMLFSAPLEFITAAFNNLANFPDRFFKHVIFNVTSQSGWLPPIIAGGAYLDALNTVIIYLLFLLIIGSHALSCLVFSYQFFRRQLTTPVVLAVLLTVSDLMCVIFYNLQNFYSAVQFIPTSVIVIVLLGSFFAKVKHCSAGVTVWNLCIMIVSIASMITLMVTVTPVVVQNATSVSSSVPGQALSIPVLGTQSHLNAIKTLGASCRLPEKAAEHIVLDHMTYFGYVLDKSPVHILYVSDQGYGGDLARGKLLPFLRSIKSPGIISRCEWMPAEFRAAAKSNDMGYCCVNLDDL